MWDDESPSKKRTSEEGCLENARLTVETSQWWEVEGVDDGKEGVGCVAEWGDLQRCGGEVFVIERGIPEG